jgi:hypothetical protein
MLKHINVEHGVSAHLVDLVPSLAEGEDGGVDQMVDGEVSELLYEIIPAHPNQRFTGVYILENTPPPGGGGGINMA